jgi:hypothetical protein
MTMRRRIALVGVAAILLQAVLFGWHHHAVALPGDRSPIASLHSTNEPPTTVQDECEICAVLHHQSAAPLAFVEPPKPSATAALSDLPSPVTHDRVDTRGFDARAPPRL